MQDKTPTFRKLRTGIVTIVLLSMCLCVTTFALAYAALGLNNNLFRTGLVKLNLNDGQPVIEEHEFLFEPGMTVEKEFFLQNLSTWDVYYKLYFENVEGGLADILDVAILHGDETLLEGKMTDLTRENVGAANDILRLNENRVFTLRFHFPEKAGNAAQGLSLRFDLGADAVQTKNNPDRAFD